MDLAFSLDLEPGKPSCFKLASDLNSSSNFRAGEDAESEEKYLR